MKKSKYTNGKISIKKIIVEKNDIYVDYKVSKNLEDFFDLNNKFHIHYYDDISTVPKEIAVIPFVSNVLPIIWLTDSTLEIDSIEKKYANSIDQTRKAFNEMYKTNIFKGKINIKEKVEIIPKSVDENVSVFYSGGVDSTSSLVSCFERKEKPLLITIWGTDVWDYNVEGFETLQSNAVYTGKKYNLTNLFIKTNFRKFIYEHNLTDKLLKNRIDDSWWRGIQHGIGLIGHVAPYAYTKNIKIHYIPATLNNKNDGSTCGSFPTIDQSVEFMNCKINHEGYDLDRLDKVKHIINYFKNNNQTFPLRVCYMDKGRKLNCCECEKCYLTIMEILSLHENPSDWGFEISKKQIANIHNHLLKKASNSPINVEIWNRIKNEFLSSGEKSYNECKEAKWIFDYIPEQAYIPKLPKLSVIVPVYNTEKYLEKCIDSLINQDYENIEIVVVEDCSTDNSRKKLEKYKNNKKVKIIHNQKNSGLSYTRNIGLEKSSGEYIGYIDSDDYVNTNYYSSMMEEIIKENADIAICDIKIIYENDFNAESINICYTKNQNKLGFINTGLAASACNKVFKREIIEKNKFSVGKVNEDLAVVLPAIVSANKVCYVKNNYYHYIQRDASIQNSRFSDKRFDIFAGVELTLERINKCENYDEISEAIIFHQLIVLLIYVIPKEKNIIRRYQIIKKFNNLSKKYNIRQNRYLKEFIKKSGKKHGLYYNLLFNLTTHNLYLCADLSMCLFDFLKFILVKKNVIKKDINLEDVIKVAKKQSSLKENDIKISVIIPNYNYEKYLYERIYSILNQKEKIYELIILDDCSTDNSRELIDDLVEKLSEYINIKKNYNKTNSGSAFKQWKQGFDLSTGDYIWIAEADDYCNNNFLKSVIKPIREEKNIIISYCDTAFVREDGTVKMKSIKKEIDLQKTNHWNKSFINDGISEIKDYAYLNCTIANVSSTLIKKGDYEKILKESGNYKQAGDWYFYVNVMKNGKIAYSNKANNYYRLHGTNVSSTMDSKKHIDEINKIHDYIYKEFKLNNKHKTKMNERIEYLKNIWEVKDE